MGSDYKVNIYNDEMGNGIYDYYLKVRCQKGDKASNFKINAACFLELKIDEKNEISKDKYIKLEGFNTILLVDKKNQFIISDFHVCKEKIRAFFKKSSLLQEELNFIDRKNALSELVMYMTYYGERKGFGNYFKERFPKESKHKYSYNIAYMFQNYQSIFDLESIPHKQVIEYETTFRTKTTWDRSYVYPLKEAHYVSVVPYNYKAVICTICEMKLWEVRDEA